jgi:hypothetical protein
MRFLSSGVNKTDSIKLVVSLFLRTKETAVDTAAATSVRMP